MSSSDSIAEDLRRSIGLAGGHVFEDDVARLEIHGNQVVGQHLLPGLEVAVEEREHGIRALIRLEAGTRIDKPVHICFGVMPERGRQDIEMDVTIEEQASVDIMAHCTFPNAVDVQHNMQGIVRVGQGASYTYYERHIHGPAGGTHVVPHAKIYLDEDALFKTDFELIRGRCGVIDIDYEAEVGARAVVDMLTRVSGREDDYIRIREAATLSGEGAAGILTSHIALREQAQAVVENELTALAPHARGHVDCKEIVLDQARARAVPIVNVQHPKAHVTHEAAIGSVDSKQLQTLMARGLSEEQAADLIIQGLLEQSNRSRRTT